MHLISCRAIAVVLLTLHLAACTSWQPTAVSPRRLIEEERPQSVRVTRFDGTNLVARNPVIRNDSIAVVSGECRRLPGLEPRYSCPTSPLVALDDVRGIAVRARSSWVNPAFGLGMLFGVGLLVMAAGFEGFLVGG